MSLALQAHSLGIRTHAMAGIDLAAAHERLGVDRESYAAMCGIAAGRLGPREALPAELQERERARSDREAAGRDRPQGALDPRQALSAV